MYTYYTRGESWFQAEFIILVIYPVSSSHLSFESLTKLLSLTELVRGGLNVQLLIGGMFCLLNLNPVKVLHCFHEQETLSSLLSTGWFQEQVWSEIRFGAVTIKQLNKYKPTDHPSIWTSCVITLNLTVRLNFWSCSFVGGFSADRVVQSYKRQRPREHTASDCWKVSLVSNPLNSYIERKLATKKIFF